MEKKLALLCCLLTIIIVGSCVFAVNKTIDFPTIFHALKVVIPAAIVAYICGLYMGKTLLRAQVDTEIINAEIQQQFVDDILLSPDEVLNRTVEEIEEELEQEKKQEPQAEKENK